MTRPKKWFLDQESPYEDSGSPGIVLKSSEGLLKKPNATQTLGRVSSVSTSDSSPDGILFKCENGRIILPLKAHEWNKTDTSAKFAWISTPKEFVSRWEKEVSGTSAESSVSPSSDLKEPRTSQSSRKRSHSSASSSSSSSSRKRPLQSSLSPASISQSDMGSPSKRCKFMRVSIDESIEKCRKGLMELPVKQLFHPPKESRLLREPDPTFVRNLKDKMIADPAAPGATAMAVLCKDIDVISDFNAKFKDVYKYEVLGGNHTLVAKSQLTTEYPDNPFFKMAMAEVYVGLTDEEALRLAQRHNLNSHFVHKVTHRDLVEACRARLYRMEGQNMDEETPKPSSVWRESCKKAIIPEDTGEAQEKYPVYVQLQKFLKVDLNKSIPQSFTDFCTRAKQSEGQSFDPMNGSTVRIDTYVGHVIHSKVTEVNGQAIKSAFSGFKGANLAITAFDKNASREFVESTSYTLKEINTVASCSIYSAAALCTPEVWNLVEEVWGRAYMNTDLLCFANTNPRCATGTPAKKLTPPVTVVILGFFSPDDEMKEEHFNFDAQECKQNYFVGTENEFFTFLITHFCPPESTVLDISCLHGPLAGTMPVAALQAGRNTVSVVDSEELFSTVLGKMSNLVSDTTT